MNKNQDQIEEAKRVFVEVIKIKTERFMTEVFNEEECDFVFQEINELSMHFVLENLEFENKRYFIPKWVNDTLIELGWIREKSNDSKN